MSSLIDLPPERAMPESQLLAREHGIVRYASGPVGRPAGRRAARYAAILVGASILTVGGTALGYVAFRPATVPVSVELRCYTVASLEGGDNFPGTSIGMGSPAGRDGTTDPPSAVAACADLWRDGFLELGQRGINTDGCVEGGPCPPPDRPVHPVPPLVACTLDSGVAAVFPGDADTCAELGLPQLIE
jgi:hypothetical protein